MDKAEYELARTTTLQLIRQAIRSRNLTRLREGFARPWAANILTRTDDDEKFSGEYKIFAMAVEGMKPEERQKAFQWTWDCYHPLMGALGKVLEDTDGFTAQH